MIRQFITAEQLFEIYRRRRYSRPKESYMSIASDMGLSYHTVAGTDKRVHKYVFHPERMQRKNSIYVDAARKVSAYIKLMSSSKEEVIPVTRTPQTNQKPVVDHYQKLNDAFESLRAAVEDFMVAELENRTQGVQEKLARLQRENEEMSKIIQSDKANNWVTNLKKKLGASNS